MDIMGQLTGALADVKQWFLNLVNPALMIRGFVGGLIIAIILVIIAFPLLKKVPFVKKAIPR